MRVKSRLEHCSHGAEQEQALQRRLEVQELLSRLLSSTGVRRRRASDMHSLSNLKGCEPYAARTVLGGGVATAAGATNPSARASIIVWPSAGYKDAYDYLQGPRCLRTTSGTVEQ
jgi:hypothetical protein